MLVPFSSSASKQIVTRTKVWSSLFRVAGSGIASKSTTRNAGPGTSDRRGRLPKTKAGNLFREGWEGETGGWEGLGGTGDEGLISTSCEAIEDNSRVASSSSRSVQPKPPSKVASYVASPELDAGARTDSTDLQGIAFTIILHLGASQS